MSIRSFRNSDLPVLLDIWIRHFSAFARPPAVSLAKFEQAVVARTFFRAAHLLVAEDNGVATGWIAMAPCQQDATNLVVCALCFLPTHDQAGKDLLSAAEARGIKDGFLRMQVGLVRDQTQGYAGLEPFGHGIAVPVRDQRTTALLTEAGFSAEPGVVQMIATTIGYRPPMSRESMQLRRTAKVTQKPHLYKTPHQAAAMSHLDVETIHLLNASGEELASVTLWCSDPEAEVMDPATAIIDLGVCQERGKLTAAESYLIGATLQQLGQQRVMNVEVVVDCENTELISQLETLKFQAGEQGTAWRKKSP